ncbi:MAG: multidrug efflux SMR transporter [Deltaproteobacteria bacterium]|nr:multidrug efflux SMR transporter [Deltaproteobacteria bacterium]
MAWIYLLLAGMFEIAWAVGLKYADGPQRALALAGVSIALVASLALLSVAMRTIPLGTAYAVWMGIGALGSVVAGVWLFGESLSPARLCCVALLLIALVGLKATAESD